MLYVEQIEYSEVAVLKYKLTYPEISVERDEFFKECIIKYDDNFILNVIDSETGVKKSYNAKTLRDLYYSDISKLYIPNVMFNTSLGVDYTKCIHIADLNTLSFRLEFCRTFGSEEKCAIDVRGYNSWVTADDNRMYKVIRYDNKVLKGNFGMANIAGLGKSGNSALVLGYDKSRKLLSLSLYNKDKLISEIDVSDCISQKDMFHRRDIIKLAKRLKDY